MKHVEERLRELPQIADSTGLQANAALKRRILDAANGKKQQKKRALRLVPALCCAVAVLVGAGVFALSPASVNGPTPTSAPLIILRPQAAP